MGNRKSYKTIAATGVVAVVLLSILGSCKGRRIDNMEPTGDTVDVVIETVTDSETVSGDTIQEVAASTVIKRDHR